MITRHCAWCGAAVQRYPSLVRCERSFCGRSCLGRYRSTYLIGPAAAHWKGGVKYDRGRVLLHRPGHRLATKKGYVARARLVAEEVLGRPLQSGEIAHHRDLDPTNDQPDNIQTLPSQREHARQHGLRRSAEQMAAMRAARKEVAA